MNEPPRKRRKTSSPAQAPSSPLRKPPRRPSFASPTKASLARNYPDLLPPNRTPVRDEIRARGKQGRAFVLGENDAQPKETTPTGEDEAELPATSSQKGLEEQEGARRGVLFSSSGKRPPRATDMVKEPPLRSNGPSVQQDQPARPIEYAPDKTKVRKQPLDPVVEKKKQEKARLRRELEELEAQVSRCTDEIAAEQQRGAEDSLPPTQRTELIKFIRNISDVDTQDEQPAPISSLLCSFLPFSSLSIPPPKPKHSAKPVPSHRPLDLKDPLPYLEMFTSFTFSTQLSLPRGKISLSSTRVRQRHTIDISGPQKLLTAQLAVNIDCITNNIVDMHVLHLPSWAERELGTFMRNAGKEKDLGNACWALDSFWDIAVKRANYWHKCETSFPRLLPGRTPSDVENASTTNTKSTKLSRKDLARYLGRDVLILQDAHVLLKISWRIVFDWTGEAESCVDVECAVPSVWQEADASESFHKIPETFASLLRAHGAFKATRTMVALLFPQ